LDVVALFPFTTQILVSVSAYNQDATAALTISSLYGLDIPFVAVNVLKLNYANPISTSIKPLVRASVTLSYAFLGIPRIPILAYA
jgi:hypothetical protein